MLSNSFPKIEKLCSRTHIHNLFENGESLKQFPFKMLYIPIETPCKTPVKVLISVPKRIVKRAVVRNRIKRLIREAYRLQKQNFYIENNQFAIGFIYLLRKEIPFAEMVSILEEMSQTFKQTFIENKNK